TQIAMKEKGWSPKPIDFICFTHYHADHISGLPGLLLSMGNAERTEPVTMIGPKGLTRVVNALRSIAPELPFEIRFIELNDAFESFDFDGFRLEAFRVQHNMVCYAYNMLIDRAGKFDADRAKEQNIPLQFWNRLQKGETIEDNGVIFTPEMVLGPERKGIKLTYCTDSRPTDAIAKHAKGADLFICEGMYGEPGMEEKAKEHKHMTFYEAAALAKAAGVKELWLTHYSPSMPNPKEFRDEVRKVFANTHTCKDGRSVDLAFMDE
ncbi:MAG: ribonuclease Z, partial [Lachnospiraceae bacterium]|nr:ribonuclease Z [Lachnospiraceae bacterium]